MNCSIFRPTLVLTLCTLPFASAFAYPIKPEKLPATLENSAAFLSDSCQQQFSEYLKSDIHYKAFAVYIEDDSEVICTTGRNSRHQGQAGYAATAACEEEVVAQGGPTHAQCEEFALSNDLQSPFLWNSRTRGKPSSISSTSSRLVRKLSEAQRAELTEKAGLVLRTSCKKFFRDKYLAAKGAKAFGYTVDEDGLTACGYGHNDKSVENVKKRALASCNKNKLKRKRTPQSECKVFAVNHKVVLGQKDYNVDFTPADSTPMPKSQSEHISTFSDIYMSMGTTMSLWGYTEQDGHKAFYYARDKNGNGVSGRSYGRPSLQSAHKKALTECKENKAERTKKIDAECTPFMVGNEIVADLEALGMSDDKNSMFKAALQNDRYKKAKLLLADGADHTIVADGGVTAVSIALLHGDQEMLDDLIAKGLSSGATLTDGTQAVHLAAAGGNIAMLKQILDDGADINAQDNETKSTPLHYAAARLSRKSIRFLLASGADDSLVNAEGQSGRDMVNALVGAFGFEKDYFDKPDPDE